MIRCSIRTLTHSIAVFAIAAITTGGAHAQPAPDPSPTGLQSAALPEPPLGAAPAPARGMFTPKRWLALGVAGVTLVSAAVFAVEGQRAADAHDSAYELCGDPDVPCRQGDQANVLMAEAHHHARIANIALAAGVASMAIAIVLWERGAPDAAARVSIVPRVAPGEAGLVAAGSF